MKVQKFLNSLILRTIPAVVVVFVLALSGCEDDPILEAPSGAASSGGSYGKLSIDTSSGSSVREIQLNEQRINPITF